MKNYKSLEAHKFFISGWVDVVLHHKPSAGITVFKTQVKPSWRVTDKSHDTWVAAKRTGEVKAAHCDCMAGDFTKPTGSGPSRMWNLRFRTPITCSVKYQSVFLESF
ncbi:hypothetical protein ANANG_G00101860 [Anguilla anguilla]|uniref:Uncharacterized protein n=1 Tax=Anguilla anguilla TaxID=7936 RepID=A0A9D3MJZ4_ANGAN|nr:hypothetical protein ANANG_G00101860 [Anguilla anguilla]